MIEIREEQICAIVNDLLPIYIEEICSEETKKFIAEHLVECSNCKHTYETMMTPLHSESIPEDIVEPETEELLNKAIKKTSRAIRKKAIKTIVLVVIGLILAILLACAFLIENFMPDYVAIIIFLAIGALVIANWMNETEYRRLKEDKEDKEER